MGQPRLGNGISAFCVLYSTYLVCFSACAAVKLIPKEKKKKKKARSEGLDEWMQAFRLKNFPCKGIERRNWKNGNRKNFKRNPEGLNLQERKTSPYI